MSNLTNKYQAWGLIIFFALLITIALYIGFLYLSWEWGSNWGSFEQHLHVWQRIISEIRVLKTDTYYKYISVMNDYSRELFLHLLLPLFAAALIGATFSFKMLYIKGGRDTGIHIDGSKLYQGKYAIKHAHKSIKKELKNNKTLGLKLHPDVVITQEQEVGNLLVTGAQGSGKSTIIKPLVNNIINSGSRMLIYDAKREYTELFCQKGHFLLSPTDRRSLCWDISADVTSPEVALEIASCFISQTGKDPIWSNGARIILAGCMVVLMNTHPNWWWAELKELLNKPTKELNELFRKYYPDAAKLSLEDSKTTDSFMMELTTKLNWLDYVAKVWTKKSKNKFSVTKWVKGKYKIQSLIIPNNPKYSSISAPLCSAVLSIVVREVLSLPDNKQKFWFVLDELADLPKTDALEKWLALGRSKGARTIAGTQNISQLQAIYGDAHTETITSLFSNIIALKIGNSSTTARKVADNFGKRIVKRPVINFDKYFNKSTSYQQSEEYIVRPEQLMQLPLPNKKGVKGYLSIQGREAVYELVWPYSNLPKIASAYIPIKRQHKNQTSKETSRRGSRGRNKAC